MGIADPDVDRAQDVLKQKLQGPHSLMYKDCQVFSTYQDALLNTTVHVAFIGEEVYHNVCIDVHGVIHTHLFINSELDVFSGVCEDLLSHKRAVCGLA